MFFCWPHRQVRELKNKVIFGGSLIHNTSSSGCSGIDLNGADLSAKHSFCELQLNVTKIAFKISNAICAKFPSYPCYVT